MARPVMRLARALANSHGTWRLNRLGYLDFANHHPAGALAPQGGDLWFLYSLVRNRKPGLIIELGSGCSTVIFAQALYDNQRDDPGRGGMIISLDGMAEWAEVTRASVPNYLAALCDIRHVGVVEEDRNQGRDLGYHYETLPDGDPNFLYVDGPALKAGRKICFDALHLQDRFRASFTMVVDGRHDTVHTLTKHLSGRYRVTRNRWLHNTRFDLLP